MRETRVLVLAGTSEARKLCESLADRDGVEAIASLAGRTREPMALPVETRVGGFGGAQGLAQYLRDARIDMVIDATHPFAVQISANAVAACQAARKLRLSFGRDPWVARAGDVWSEAATLEAAAQALGTERKRVFLSHGRMGIAAFKARPEHAYVMRAVDAPEANDLPPDCKVILGRGPFRYDDELRLLADEGIAIIVAKNGGGPGAKIDAARALKIPVLMLKPPAPPAGDRVTSLEEALDWIDAHRAAP